MIIHEINDLSNTHVISLLQKGLSECTESVQNYHPDHSDNNANLFYVLKNGRYQLNRGKYYVMEESGKYLCSAGWNEYDMEPELDAALVLTRMYVTPAERGKYNIGLHILPRILLEVQQYSHVWITNNAHNYAINEWFKRAASAKRPALFNNWPEIYNRFKPIGSRMIYNVEQQIAELDKNLTL